MFGIFAEILFAAIKVIHKAFPNWGWSIIILTLIIKIIFFPLTYSQHQVDGQDGRAPAARSRPCATSTRSPRPTSTSGGR